MKKLLVERAVGLPLAHDVTRIVPGAVKETRFFRGHVVAPEDVEILQALGRYYVYVQEGDEEEVHENDAARALAEAWAGDGVEARGGREGRADLVARHGGVLALQVESIEEQNRQGEMFLITLPDRSEVAPGQRVATARVIPLTVPPERLETARSRGPLVRVHPIRPRATGVVITGREVWEGRVADGFGALLREKLGRYGCPIVYERICPDDPLEIRDAILAAWAQGAELVLVTGGMAVDPDDVSADGIALAGARVVAHGLPILPGSVFLVAYRDSLPVLGLPGGMLHDRWTVFDWILPQVLAGVPVTWPVLARLGVGGLRGGHGHPASGR